jgi:hypothetical protein
MTASDPVPVSHSLWLPPSCHHLTSIFALASPSKEIKAALALTAAK